MSPSKAKIIRVASSNLKCNACGNITPVGTHIASKGPNTWVCEECGFINELYERPKDKSTSNTMSYNVGSSDYADMDIQPWDVMESMGMLREYLICDIVKRCMRIKEGEDKTLDWQKIQHIAKKLEEIERG